ncbi:MAG TPA: Ig-like domain-containing protein [Actinopolymorphaceae bacterium]
MSTRAFAAIFAMIGVVALGCQPASEDENGAKLPPARIVVTPAAKSSNIEAGSEVRLTAPGGRLVEVTVQDSEGRPLAGVMDATSTSWVSSGGVAPSTTYTVRARAVGHDGETLQKQQSFTTEQADNVVKAQITPSGDDIGVGMPVVVKFDKPVQYRAAVERRMSVKSSKPVVGAWHWFGDQEVHYRPKKYWPAHSDVTVRLFLRGVKVSDDVWGAEDQVQEFGIGRSVVTKVDLIDTHHAKVYLDGKFARSIPVTGGQPGWRTRNGVKVVLEVRTGITFTDEQIGAAENYTLYSPYGLRATWSGEFLHTASWSVGSHGVANVSHGCVGMNLENSRWLWKHSQVGDPIEFRSDGEEMAVTGNGYGDWNLSWTEWQKGSALRQS